MSTIGYYLLLPLVYMVSYLPFFLLYKLSDGLYFLVYHVFKYRKKVVINNLSNSFPEKSKEEILHISEKFYRYFCDLILETLKTLTISAEQVRKHVVIKDHSVFKKLYEEQKSAIIVMGHFGNWELAGAAFSQEPFHQLFVIYHPLANKHFDALVYKMRTRLGNKLYAMNDAIRGMIKDKNLLSLTAFIADQTPSPKNAYWTQFLNQDTPVFTGTEKIAKKLNYPVVYIRMRRPKRGIYYLESELLVLEPNSTLENEISELHTRKLEEDILLQPEIWLWTHKRWKHKRGS